MSAAIVQTAPLGPQWPTIDPFLFCAHHRDLYPVGDGTMAPRAPLAGREIGADFSGCDGWSMYHGTRVPGFPQHPHRGFETVTILREGTVDHSDSLGATARFGAGDVQWMTAGRGIVHAEMFPLLHDDRPNPLELFQVWVNLPARSKMVDPYFTMMWADDVAHHRPAGGVDVAVIGGRLGDTVALPPPPDSWAADPSAGVAIWHVTIDPAATWTLPAAEIPGVVRTLYAYRGPLTVDGVHFDTPTAVLVEADADVPLAADESAAHVLVLQGRPIGEPVAQYGPFVMNDEVGIRQAIDDFQTTGFGGWPWTDGAPVHTRSADRFAKYTNGRFERPKQTS